MASSDPLTGAVLVDCARANIGDGVTIAAERCGYGSDTDAFEAALRSACNEMGIAIDDFSDLVAEDRQEKRTRDGIEVAPDTVSDL